jgi:hypothetical protein
MSTVTLGVDESCRQMQHEDEVAIGGLSGKNHTEKVYDAPSSKNESESV